MKNKPIKVFFDMDGVLNQYDLDKDTETAMWEPGYFLNMQPDHNALSLLKDTLKKKKLEVHILSKSLNDQCTKEKEQWLDNYLPEIPKEQVHIIPFKGPTKREYVLTNNLQGSQLSILIDDLTKNLLDWELESSFFAIKYFNHSNSRNWLKRNKCYLDFEWLAEDQITNLFYIVEKFKIENKRKPID